MGLNSMALRLKATYGFNDFPTTSDTDPKQKENKPALTTNRHFRHLPAANEGNAIGLVTPEGMPVYYFDGGIHGHHYGDREWVKGKLRRVRDKSERLKLAGEYAKCYQSAYEQEPVDHRKDGKARFIANSWLLKITM